MKIKQSKTKQINPVIHQALCLSRNVAIILTISLQCLYILLPFWFQCLYELGSKSLGNLVKFIEARTDNAVV